MSRRHNSRAVPYARLTILAQVSLAAIVTAVLFSATGVRIALFDKPYTVQAVVPDAAGLSTSDRPTVTVAGVKSGAISSVRYAGAKRAVITLELDDSARGKLFADATLRIRPRSVLNDLVVEVDPGDPTAGPLRDGRIERAAPAPVGYDRILGILDADGRAYTQILIGTIREMLRDRPGDLRAAFTRLPAATDAVAAVTWQLAHRRRKLSALVDQLDAIVTVTGRRGNQIERAVTDAQRTLAVTAARERELKGTITALPGLLSQTDRTFATIRDLARPLAPALAELRPVARALPSGLRGVRSLLPELNAASTDLETLARDGRAPLRSLRRTLTTLAPAARRLVPAMPTVEKTARALADNRGPISDMLRWWSSTLSSQNSLAVLTRSIILRVLPVEPRAVGLPRNQPQRKDDLSRALTAFSRARPKLIAGLPARLRKAADPVVAVAALTEHFCLRGNAAACQILAELAAKPPRMRGS